jgi:hypothetical protein
MQLLNLRSILYVQRGPTQMRPNAAFTQNRLKNRDLQWAGRAGLMGLRVPEQILKLFECQSVLLKILRLYVKNNPVKLIPY